MNTPRLIDGKAASARVLEQVRREVGELLAQAVQPALAVILVGSDPASQVYVRNKILRADEVGIRSQEHRLPGDTSTEQLLNLIKGLNDDPSINGILLQLPLPAQIDELRALEAIDPRKDVDGFHSENVGGLSQGRDVLAPCTPSGCLHLLEQTCGELRGKHAVVVGRSNIVGKPMAALLLKADCSVTVLHSRSRDAQALCRQADIVIAAVGRAGLIDASWLKPGAVVIDVGINRIDTGNGSRLVGDVDFANALPQVSAITPVPGGVGPMTIAFLMKNTVIAARQQHQAQRNQSEAVCHSIY